MVISFRPRTTRSVPEGKSSDEIVLPSAVIVVQDSSRAWMTTVNSPGVAAGEAGAMSGDILGTPEGADGPDGELVGGALVVGKSEPDGPPMPFAVSCYGGAVFRVDGTTMATPSPKRH